jgi:hypothetical protein
MTKLRVLAAGTATVLAVAVAAPSAAACSAANVSVGAVDVGLLGTVSVHTDPIALDVGLSGLVGSLVCGLIGGGGAPPRGGRRLPRAASVRPEAGYNSGCRPGDREPAVRPVRGKSGHRRAGRWGNPRRRKPTESGTERKPPPAYLRRHGR